MDAFDIFNKLTKGLTFKTRILGAKKKQKNVADSKYQTDDVKNEKETEDLDDSQGQDETDGESNNDPEENYVDTAESENEMSLLNGVTINGKKKRRKKEKTVTEDKKKKLGLEEQNRFRNEFGIRVVGRGVPAAINDINCLSEKYNMSPTLIDSVQQCGYTEPTPIQRQAIPCLLENRQILACAPTGSGKTAAFLLPVLQHLGAPQGGPRALVLCPTRELAKQIYREALRLTAGTNLRCNIISKISQNKLEERQTTIRKSDLIISTPNRLCFLLNQEGTEISLDRVRWLIIDEADKLFEGSSEQEADFRQQMEQVMAACNGKERRIAMFSATHTPAVAKWCRYNMKGLINITVGQRNAATDLVEQQLQYCGNEAGKLVAFRQLVQQGLKPPVLIFVQSKDRAKQLFKELIYDGINVDVIHADRTQLQRDNVVKSFRLGKIWVLICTELMGRGIDFRGVNLVLNYDFPPSAISYIHRIGRAGRAGQKGKAITYFTQDDVANLRSIAAVLKQSGCEVPEYMLKLKQNAAARKKLVKKAPHRDQISTVLEKNRRKRQFEHKKKDSNKESAESSAIATKSVNNSKHKKVRKMEKNTTGNIKKKNKQSDDVKDGNDKKKNKTTVNGHIKSIKKIGKKNKNLKIKNKQNK